MYKRLLPKEGFFQMFDARVDFFYHSRSFLKIYLKARHLVSVKDSRGLYLYFRTVLLILNRYCKTELCLHIYVKTVTRSGRIFLDQCFSVDRFQDNFFLVQRQ